jgi:GMP synthase-like glutamine amidotransferase
MNLVCLQHVASEGPGAIAPWAKKAGHTLTVIRLDKGEPIPPVNTVDGVIVLGGPMSVNDGEEIPWLRAERRIIEGAISSERMVVGICLGAQHIAKILGAGVRRAPHKEIGWFPVQWRRTTASSMTRGFGVNSVPVFHWHGETFDIPLGASHLASSEGCPNQAFLYGRHVLAMQFHLEVTNAYVSAWVKQGDDDLKPGPFVQSAEAIEKGTEHIPANIALLHTLLDRLVESTPVLAPR